MACCAIYPRSQLDSAQTTRKAFSCAEEAHRVINSCSLIDKRNSRIDLTYRLSPNCECVCTMIFYNDVTAEINTITTDEILRLDQCLLSNNSQILVNEFSTKNLVSTFNRVFL